VIGAVLLLITVAVIFAGVLLLGSVR